MQTEGILFPPSVAAKTGRASFRQDHIGESDATVLLYDDYVLKIRPENSWNTNDVQVMQWLAGKLPVPEIAAHEVADGKDWLLMTRIKGKMLCDPSVMEKPTVLLDCMAEALNLLWSVDIGSCPFTRTAEDRLSQAEKILLAGKFDSSDCEPETFGPGGFENPVALLNWLRTRQPPVDHVLVHGDFCLPNLFTDGKRFIGYIDLGNMSLGDRWMDLALGWRSLKHNADGHYGKVFLEINPDDLFRAAGVQKDEEKLWYYLLLDELN